MAESHTPGPWTWDGGGGVDAENGPGHGGAVADVAESHEGNARLIAAAPDLEELLEEIAEMQPRHSALELDEVGTFCLHCGAEWPCPFDRAVALLARVKGEPVDG